MTRAPGFATVFFDCDSTLVRVEGIDELASRAGVGLEMARLTDEAMSGRVPLERVYERRLDAVSPTHGDLVWLADRYVSTLVDGAREVVAALHALDKEVHVVSGGLAPAVIPLGRELGIPEERIHAVQIRFDQRGCYAGFDLASPLARRGGKAEVCRRVLTGRSGRSALVGDGTTDLEAKSVCDAVIGFGGVALREEVRRRATLFVADERLHPILPLLVDEPELERLTQLGFGDLVREARSAPGPEPR